MKFKLEIELGNDAAQTGEDIAAYVARVADQLESGYTSGVVMDLNGNRIGKWEVK